RITVQTFPNQKPWVNGEVRAKLKEDRRLQLDLEYRKSRYALRRAISSAKRQYRDKVESHYKGSNTRSMWAGLKTLTDYKKKICSAEVMSASLSDELNTFYARFESTSPAVEVQKAQEDHCPPVISRADVCRTLKRLLDHDGIPGRALKVCADQLADVFADIFNVSLLQSVVPTCFKETIIVPVPKKTKILSLNDYRPVALTSTIMKCFERSAFNTIVPSKLVTKLRDLGLNSALCDWILNFLTSRPQAVRMGSTTSSTLTLNTGAPQGCVLSPLLYSLFTHDCVATHSSNTIIKFADDTTDNNLHLNVQQNKGADRGLQEEAERGTRPPLHQRDYGGESQAASGSSGFTSVRTSPGLITLTLSHKVSQTAALLPPQAAEEAQHGLKDTLQLLQVHHRESILTGCITTWYSSCTALNRKALQRVVKTAQYTSPGHGAAIHGGPLHPAVPGPCIHGQSDKGSGIFAPRINSIY
ncbi:hypothetical protein L3Q82_017655, partial [Scortum barcoo]